MDFFQASVNITQTSPKVRAVFTGNARLKYIYININKYKYIYLYIYIYICKYIYTNLLYISLYINS